MKKPRDLLIAGNWKMNFGPSDAERYFAEFAKLWNSRPLPEGLRVSIMPPHLSLSAALWAVDKAKLPVTIGAQNAHWETHGAFTGEISGPMLREIGIGTVLLGHSERRQYFGETDATVRRRSASLQTQKFDLVVCVGETLEERRSGQTDAVVEKQLDALLAPESANHPGMPLSLAKLPTANTVTIAYEPVWAIGTGLTATPEQAEAAHSTIRRIIAERSGEAAASSTPILYGGSVTPENAKELLRQPNIDGALVGGASLKPAAWMQLLDIAAECLK